MIEAIPTLYRGVRFRSRLEARWATFFDAMKIKWKYEPKRFRLSTEQWYIPDFFLPDFPMFYEVKPNRETDNHKANQLALDYWDSKADYHRDFPIAIAYGDIPDPATVKTSHYGPQNIDVVCDYGYSWCVCPKCHKPSIQFEGRSGRIDCPCDVDEKDCTYDADELLTAYRVARSRKFVSAA